MMSRTGPRPIPRMVWALPPVRSPSGFSFRFRDGQGHRTLVNHRPRCGRTRAGVARRLCLQLLMEAVDLIIVTRVATKGHTNPVTARTSKPKNPPLIRHHLDLQHPNGLSLEAATSESVISKATGARSPPIFCAFGTGKASFPECPARAPC
jgi:hypothetical protein